MEIPVLDSEEYFHLAINATQNNQHHAALEYLHKCLELSPSNAQAIFLLAAEHAELGLYNRAIEGMEKSLSIDPTIEMAYYQLALLYIQQGNNFESLKLWEHLKENSKDQTLQFFAQGMLLLDSHRALAIDLIRKALEQETQNKALQKSIENILTGLLSSNEEVNKAQSKDSEPLHPMFLNAYKQSSFESDDK